MKITNLKREEQKCLQDVLLSQNLKSVNGMGDWQWVTHTIYILFYYIVHLMTTYNRLMINRLVVLNLLILSGCLCILVETQTGSKYKTVSEAHGEYGSKYQLDYVGSMQLNKSQIRRELECSIMENGNSELHIKIKDKGGLNYELPNEAPFLID